MLFNISYRPFLVGLDSGRGQDMAGERRNLVGYTSVLSQESGGDGPGHQPGGLDMGVTRRRREYGWGDVVTYLAR
jgi:hypothetical protein